MADILKSPSPAARLNMSEGRSLFVYGALIIFFFMLAGYGGLLLLNRAQEGARDELQEEVRLKEENVRPELLNEITALEERLKNFRTLLDSHVVSTGPLALLERLTHPQVRFTNFNFTPGDRKLDLTGEAASYGVLARQIVFFEGEPLIERVEFGGLSLGQTNVINFKASLVLAPSMLQFGAASPSL